jgi:hypothetical protein
MSTNVKSRTSEKKSNRGRQDSNPQPLEDVVCMKQAEIQCATITPRPLVVVGGENGNLVRKVKKTKKNKLNANNPAY